LLAEEAIRQLQQQMDREVCDIRFNKEIEEGKTSVSHWNFLDHDFRMVVATDGRIHRHRVRYRI
jgi:hypothetical protein